MMVDWDTIRFMAEFDYNVMEIHYDLTDDEYNQTLEDKIKIIFGYLDL